MSDTGIFKAAVKLPPDQRAAYLNQACGANLELRREVESLLHAHDETGSFLETPPAQSSATIDGPPLTEKAGAIIGPYKLLQQIGEGGMGVVYMAEQQEPVRRKVALKIIKPGMDSHQVIARFEAERQALAMMDHQNIARVLDAGTTESGRPYFVMELVNGVPITRFCDDNKLTPRERLALFVPVCQAIQHAHQKGIIHRDVKPSNVLVTMYDDKPVPKVIDFGVAKAIEQRLTEKTMFTQFGALVGTFEYMSPEQAEMNAFGVDTRSDIYSLGVLLYELLTGTTPLERTRLRAAALDEMVRLIREEEAPRPSVRLSSSNNLPKIAAARKTEPARLSKLVRGEIDWIVMKCLEKDRSRRYETANAMARDLERYLADEPVEACPPSSSYRLRKFARKHRKALATATAFAVLLVGGAVISLLLAWRATTAEREANRQRTAADDAKREALEAKSEAEKQRDEARLTAYASGMQLAQRAWEENDVVRARELLEEVPKEAAGRNLRGFEWYYLNRLCRTENLTLVGHAHSVQSVAFSPNGQRLASGSWDDTMKIWDSATGKELFSLKGNGTSFYSMAFSPDGQRLASGSGDGMVKLWDSATGKELFTLKGHASWVTDVAFSPDGRRLASGSEDGTVKQWDSATGKEQFTLKGDGERVYSVVFSPDGRLLASGEEHSAKIWDSVTGKELFALRGHNNTHTNSAATSRVNCVAFSPDGQRLASGSYDETVKIWDSATGKELFTLRGHTSSVNSVAFSPDGQHLASGSDDKTVKFWDSATGKELFAFKGHAGNVNSVAFSPDGQRLTSGSDDKTVKIWDSATSNNLFALNREGDLTRVRSVAFSPDGQRMASGNTVSTVKIWDSATGKELFTLKGNAGDVAGETFSLDGKRIVPELRDGSVKLFNSSVAFSPNGQRLASGSGDGMVKLWDGATGEELFSRKGHKSWVYSVAFSPNGQRLASASMDKTMKIWDSAAGKELFTFKGHVDDGNSVAFSPDGRRMASGSRDSTVKIWDSVTGRELFSPKGHAGYVNSVAFSPDGQRLASGSDDQTVKIWDSVTAKELFALKGHVGVVWSVAYSPDGERLASGSWDDTVKIWDSATGKELLSLKGSSGDVNSVAFSPDGRRLASGTDGFIHLWETSVSAEVQDRRAANQMVADLFRQMGFRDSVLERLRWLPGMSPNRRREALAVAQSYPENPESLNNLAWQLVKRPGRVMSDYRKAVRYGEGACQLEPKNRNYRNALGAAYYRVGNFNKALETLRPSVLINEKGYQGSRPSDRAFLAMTHHQLGNAKEAQAELLRLRQRMKDPRWAQDTEAQGFLREAEALLAVPKLPRRPADGNIPRAE